MQLGGITVQKAVDGDQQSGSPSTATGVFVCAFFLTERRNGLIGELTNLFYSITSLIMSIAILHLIFHHKH